MPIPILFAARNGVVFWNWRPVPDWVVHETKRAINREGLEVPVESHAFRVWLEMYEQIRNAAFHANNQRKFKETA